MENEYLVLGIIVWIFGVIGLVTVLRALKRVIVALIWGSKQDRMRAIGWDSPPTVKDSTCPQ